MFSEINVSLKAYSNRDTTYNKRQVYLFQQLNILVAVARFFNHRFHTITRISYFREKKITCSRRQYKSVLFEYE